MAALRPDVQERVIRASQSLNETLPLSTGAREGAEGEQKEHLLIEEMLLGGLYGIEDAPNMESIDQIRIYRN